MASKRTQIFRFLLGVVLVALVGAACSSSEPTSQAPATPEAEVGQNRDENGQETQDGAIDAADGDDRATATTVPEPTLDDQDLASVAELQAGQQVQDAQGNLIAIYGVAEWPAAFASLSDASQAGFPFFGDVEAAVDPASELLVLDVGMCAAGIDVNGFGTAEFFVHASSTETLSEEPVMDRGVLTRHPVVRPGFGFPSPAECIRGYLPVLWSGDQVPAVARYVLATRATASADVEQHVYQWELEAIEVERSTAEPDDSQDRDAGFGTGQTVTFNQGRLQDTTVVVEGWAELIGAASPIDGTRLVAVSLDFCPASTRLPEFGLSVDSWNIVAPLDDSLLGAGATQDPTATCFEGWLEFAIPFGSVPTAFFASDGMNADIGYAEWSLDDAALAAPQS